jgi:hypothetical protein
METPRDEKHQMEGKKLMCSKRKGRDFVSEQEHETSVNLNVGQPAAEQTTESFEHNAKHRKGNESVYV